MSDFPVTVQSGEFIIKPGSFPPLLGEDGCAQLWPPRVARDLSVELRFSDGGEFNHFDQSSSQVAATVQHALTDPDLVSVVIRRQPTA